MLVLVFGLPLVVSVDWSNCTFFGSVKMLSEAEMLNLPDDPEMALCELHKKLKIAVYKNVEMGDPNSEISDNVYKGQHVDIIISFLKVHDISITLPDVSYDWHNDFDLEYKIFVNALNRHVYEHDFRKLKHIKEGTVTSVEFSSEEKAEIHERIDNIRCIIEKSGLSDDKKNAVYAKLNAIAAEVDRVATRTDMFFGLFLDASIALGRGAEHAKPFFDEVRSIIQSIFRAKSRSEGVALPPAADIRFLEDDSRE